MVCALKMRHLRLRSQGASGSEVQGTTPPDAEQPPDSTVVEEGDWLAIMNVHMHYMTAKKEINNPPKSVKHIWDEIASNIVVYGVRVLAGDFNMALFNVIPELRARGFLINLAAWYPWKQEFENHARIDSTGIFLIGGVASIRLCYDCQVLDVEAPAVAGRAWRKVTQKAKDENGVDAEEEYRLQAWEGLNPTGASGYPLKSYRPLDKDRPGLIRRMVSWTFTSGCDYALPAMAEARKAGQEDRQMFYEPVLANTGEDSWSWKQLPPCRQKLVDPDKFDPKRLYFRKGAHEPLLVFLGAHSDVRRSKAAAQKRHEKAERRAAHTHTHTPQHTRHTQCTHEPNQAWMDLPEAHGDVGWEGQGQRQGPREGPGQREGLGHKRQV